MDRASVAEAVQLIKELGIEPTLNNKAQILAALGNEPNVDTAFKMALRSQRLSVDISTALEVLLDEAGVTPAEAGDLLIGKGADPEEVQKGLQSADLDQLDDINGKPDDDLLQPFLEQDDPQQAHDKNYDFNSQKLDENDDREVIQGLATYVARNPSADDFEIEKFLERNGFDSDKARACIRIIKNLESQQKLGAQGISIHDLGDILENDFQKPRNQVVNQLVNNDIPLQEAVRIKTPHDLDHTAPGGGAPNPGMDPMTEEGGEMPFQNDLDTTDVGGSDLGGTGLGDEFGITGEGQSPMGSDPNTAMNMDELQNTDNPSEELPSEIQESRPGEIPWGSFDTDGMSDEEKAQLSGQLQQEGIPAPEIREGLDEMSRGQTPNNEDRLSSVNNGVSMSEKNLEVAYNGHTYRVAATTSTVWGDVYVLDGGRTIPVEAAEVIQQKTASGVSTVASLTKEAHDFLGSEYTEDFTDLKRMAKTADDLAEKLALVRTEETHEIVSLRSYFGRLKTAAKVFTEAAQRKSVESEEYLASLPTYKMAKYNGHVADIGPGGGESLAIAAQELELDRAAIDWNKVAVVEAANFVDDSPWALSSSGDMRKAANRYLAPKVAHLEGEKQETVRQQFLSNVEKARRATVRELTNRKEAKVAAYKPSGPDYDERLFI